MAFIDKLKDSLNSASQDVGNKVTAATGSVKLNGQLKSNTRMMEKLYYQVGVRCFEKEKEKLDTIYEEFFQEIRNLQEQNKKIEMELQALSSPNVCPSCGVVNSMTAKFCVGCGTPLLKEAQSSVPEEGKRCMNCGAMNEEDAVYCTNCGKKME